QKYVDLLEEAVALLGHERPRPALPDVQLRALELLVAKLRKERRGERGEAKTEAPRCAAPARGSSPERDGRGSRGTAPARASSAGDERLPRGHGSHGRYVPRSVRRVVWAR